MKIGKWYLNFSKLTLGIVLLYVVRVIERAMDMIEFYGDLTPLAYLLPAVIGWGTITISFYSWKSKNENVPWNEAEAKSKFGDDEECFDEFEGIGYTEYDENYGFNNDEEGVL